MKNIYEQLDENKRKSNILMLFFIVFISLVGYVIGYVSGYPIDYFIIALLFSSIGTVITYYHSDKIAISLARAKEITQQDMVMDGRYRMLNSVVENISRVAGIPKPKIYTIPSSGMNAFATGRDPNNSAIAVTEGLLQHLNRTELEGVIAHEISHISNYDTRLMTFVAILVGVLSILTRQLMRYGTGKSKDRKNMDSILFVVGLIIIPLTPIIANLIKLAISRRREFYADASAAKLTRQPSGLINALIKISQKPEVEMSYGATAHMYIANPLDSSFMNKLFSTHPPIEERIKALKGISV